jgi:preflagellin peptidase FlaK
MEQVFTWVRIGLSLSFLTYSSWSDLKSREVSNTVWKVFAPLALLVTSTQFLFYPPYSRFLLLSNPDATASAFVNYGISFAITSVFSVALFYVGAFGGADAKALMCIALALPVPPDLYSPLSGFVSFVFPITIFSNGVIVAALSLFYALFRNLIWKLRTHQDLFEGYENEGFSRKILALLCGYKIPVEDLETSFSYPLEDLSTAEGSTRKRLLLFPKDENRKQMVEEIMQASRDGRISNMVWATPGLPMLIFITLGLVIALTIGDIVWIVIGQIL